MLRMRSKTRGAILEAPEKSTGRRDIEAGEIKEPSQCHCNVCDRPLCHEQDGIIEFRPTGRALGHQPWPYCRQCWVRHTTIVGNDHLPVSPYRPSTTQCKQCMKRAAAA